MFEGIASWYGPGFNGRPTASGAIYDQEAWTVASKELPLGTWLVVRRGEQRVLLLVNDRGPYVEGRVLDLSAAAALADVQVQGSYPVSDEQWTAGERRYYCFVSRSGGEPLTGTLAGPAA